MTNFTYIRDIPNGPNDPADDQPNMKTNTNSTDDLIAEDHYSFNISDPGGGFHKQVRMKSLLAQPSNLPPDGGTLYVKDAETLSGVLRGQLFFASDNVAAAANEFQVTRTIPSQFPTFGMSAAYSVGMFPPAGFTATSGWFFLPGGLLCQYGLYGKGTDLGSSGSVTFPFNFSTSIFNVSLTVKRALSGDDSVYLSSNPSVSGFTFRTEQVDSDFIYWTAIGK